MPNIADVENRLLQLEKKLDTETARPYEVYTAKVYLEGAFAPAVTVLENTLGDIAWRNVDDTGTLYELTSLGLFTLNKTWVQSTFSMENDLTKYLCSKHYNADLIILTSLNPAGDIGIQSNGEYYYIEIRVYP